MKRGLLASAFVLYPAAALLAQEAEGGKSEGWTAHIWGVPMIAWQIANLILVIALFIYLLRKSGPLFFRGRADQIRSQLEKATRDKEDAEARLKEVEAKMARLNDEVAAIEQASRQAAEADKARVLAEADAMRERIRKETADEIDRRLVEARRELQAYAADVVVALATEALTKGITDADEERLRNEFLSRMKEGAYGRSR